MSAHLTSTSDISPPDKYRPILEIGQGGMSRVYLALFRGPGDFNKLRVVKRLLPTLAADPEFLEMFLEEARLSARLNHANIVQINEVGFDGTHHYMAMEYLEGQSLDSVVRIAGRSGGFPVAMHLRVIADACAGLHHAHDLADIDGRPLNIVHRDVSPHNVFVTYAGQVKVLDFGIAKAADSSHQTRTGVLKGKCAYMAPEQFRNEAIDRRSDIFALGIMTWQAVTRTRIWKGLTDIEIFHKLATGEIPSPLSVDPSIPPALVDICERALAPKLEHRYRSAAELGEAIENYLATLPDAPKPRDIGRYVGDLFSDVRAKVKAAIEAEMKRADTAPAAATAEIPIFVDPNARADDETSDGGRDSRFPPPPPMALRNHSGELSIVTADMEPPKPASLRALKAFVIAGGFLVLVMGGVLTTLMLTKNHATDDGDITSLGPPVVPPPVDPSPTASAEEPTDLVPTDISTIELSLEASPSHATLLVDGFPLSSNPAKANFARDGRFHRLRATAPGYKDYEETILYDAPTRLVKITLEKDGSVAVASHGGGAKHTGNTTGSSHGNDHATTTAPTPIPPPAVNTTPPPTSQPLAATASPTQPPTAAAVTAPAATAAPGTVRGYGAVFNDNGAQVRACWDRAAMERPGLNGSLSVNVTVDPAGRVLDANISNSTLKHSRFEGCLLSAVKSWTFPAPAGGVNGKFSKGLKFQ